MEPQKKIRVALVGNPNTGRTTLLNKLTKGKQSTGNYPRVTVSVQSREIEYQGMAIEFVDLPGIYSLSSRTDEELLSREYIHNQQPDMIVNVLDMGNLERNLLLTSQLIEMGVPRIFAFNMKDEAKAKGVEIDVEKFEEILGAPVVATNARNGEGVIELLNEIVACARRDCQRNPIVIPYDDHLEQSIERTAEHIEMLHHHDISSEQSRWLAIKLLEGDETVLRQERDHQPLMVAVNHEREVLEKKHGETADMMLDSGRYAFVFGLLEGASRLDVDVAINRIDTTRVLDALLLHRWLGLPIFLLIMWVMFETTFTIGAYPMDWIDAGVMFLSATLDNAMSPSLFKDLLINGIIAGVGGTIIFLPNIVILFFFIALFNDTGYMTRGAVLVDRIMHTFGLHGKAFIPMVTGFGCNVPAIMATRTIDNPKDRLVAILVNPFISCSARLPVFILFTGAFFGEHAGTALFGVYMVSILIALVTALILSKTVIRGANTSPFIMELAPYRYPTWVSMTSHMWNNASEFLKKVGGVIVAGSIIIWFLQSFPQQVPLSRDFDTEIAMIQTSQATEAEQEEAITKLEHLRQLETQQKRYLGQIGAVIQPIFAPMNFDVNASIALITGLVAKEVVVATFGVLYSHGEEVDEESGGLRESITSSMSMVTAIAFMFFTLIYVPCIATIGVLYRETKSLNWTAFSIVLSFSLAYFLAASVSFIGGLITGGGVI
ncbi:MAG: ferrous iron transport protein B [Gammaproteobacteria bacterium]|nr:ferrous iron transport protein B [Gammaproteobacteria bacterium]